MLFDLDGTLADTEAISTGALRGAWARAQQAGEAPLEELPAMAGQPLETILARLGLPARLAELYRQEAATLTSRARLFDAALTWLTILRARQVPVGVITGKQRARATGLLQQLCIADLIGAVVDGSGHERPQPAAYAGPLLHGTDDRGRFGSGARRGRRAGTGHVCGARVYRP
ncbi:HAD family hydrolase [Streptomyces sp. TLI_146]|uniref:HAD family hydrolase n=1 Tax=Streptomyces sp. TLI_146 TaxID=1938858 RepID=UPI0015D5B23B|nr:HAD hydrolase-like protein [Streptomyces sp. TLI_146]